MYSAEDEKDLLTQIIDRLQEHKLYLSPEEQAFIQQHTNLIELNKLLDLLSSRGVNISDFLRRNSCIDKDNLATVFSHPSLAELVQVLTLFANAGLFNVDRGLSNFETLLHGRGDIVSGEFQPVNLKNIAEALNSVTSPPLTQEVFDKLIKNSENSDNKTMLEQILTQNPVEQSRESTSRPC